MSVANCFKCKCGIINGPHYPISIAIKPPKTQKRWKKTGLTLCEDCWYDMKSQQSFDPWEIVE